MKETHIPIQEMKENPHTQISKSIKKTQNFTTKQSKTMKNPTYPDEKIKETKQLNTKHNKKTEKSG
jgi:hypothetical protein